MALAYEPPDPDALLGLGDVAAAAGISRATARAWCFSGRLPSVPGPANEPLVRRRDLETWLRRRSARAGRVQVVRDPAAGADALRRLAAEVSGRLDLETVMEDLVADAMALFSLARMGFWLYDARRPRPFTLAAQHGLSDEVLDWVSTLDAGADAAGLRAIRTGSVITIRDILVDLPIGRIRDMYARNGVRSICFAPLMFRGEPLGLLVLYHDRVHEWTDQETDTARGFADQMASAVSNARLNQSVHSLAARLEAIQELAVRLNRTRDLEEIATVILEGTERLILADSIRVYRVDHERATCEVLGWKGSIGGTAQPNADSLRVAVGEGITGWVAAHNEPVLLADAATDPRVLRRLRNDELESMLAVPISFEDHVHGVIVLSAMGRDRFGPDDETTLSIFAGFAAQAIVHTTQLEQLDRQRGELEHQLASQRRLLEVNERLISTRDPKGVLEMIADSLKAIVPYDSLTIYRCDFEAGVRRAVVARDRFAEVILDYAGPIGVGITGWVIDQGEGVLANDAHLDSRSVQIPGTPFEPESMIVVPVRVAGEVVGTLNLGRMGGPEAYFSQNEFELAQLFAGQASLALENAEAHGAVTVRAEHDALTGLRNHGSFQRELGQAIIRAESAPFAVLMLDLDDFKRFNDTCGHPAGDALLASVADAMRSATRADDGLYRYGGDEFAVILPGASRIEAFEVVKRIRRLVAAIPAPTGPRVTISAGVACYPDDGRTKDELVGAADQSLYLAKPSSSRRDEDAEAARRDPYLSALDETAIALMNRHDPEDLLETIILRAAALVGTPHGFIYLLEPDGASLVVRHGIGLFVDFLGFRMPIDQGLSGLVCREGKAVAVDDYDTFVARSDAMPTRVFGAVVGVPLTSGGRPVGVIGLAAGSYERTFGPREIGALNRFAQLASIALDNAHLFEKAQRGALYDAITGLPNRDLLTDRVAHSLTWSRDGDQSPMALILLDLDRFKVINESLGHAVGDSLLVQVGERLQRCLRPGDTVARFGGDEFGIIVDGLDGLDDARRTAERILAELSEPFHLGDRDWFVTASLGIAIAWPGRAEPGDVFREAEVALVRAKSVPGPRYVLFEPEMSAATMERVELENDLRRALERRELRLHYQPLVDLATERIVGFEALLRWEHPTRGLIPPMSFIPLAEDTGLIVPIGRWVIEMACRQARTWLDEIPGSSLLMSVNLSARQFASPSLVDDIREILAATGLPADRLELEITESVLLEEGDDSATTLRALRELGVHLVLDDFGTGYSSLSYLRRLPLDTIKIDRSFVDGIDTDTAGSNLPIVQAVIALAHGLGIEVVAEGIETAGQASRLRELVCDRGQGFYYARPQPPEALRSALAAGLTAGFRAG
ncbi:MAG TPA: diguanylate cyclase [Candidatus Limnocylindrales bacterium]|nr:diguanylate cyclase [Candidatus Limnocylindrales bacterium]